MEDNGQNAAEQLQEAVEVWRRAQVVQLTPSWRGEPLPSALIELVAQRPELEASLVALLSETSQLVVAYALVTLDRMSSAALENLPEALLSRHDKIAVINGSFSNTMELGGLARQISKRSRGGRGTKKHGAGA